MADGNPLVAVLQSMPRDIWRNKDKRQQWMNQNLVGRSLTEVQQQHQANPNFGMNQNNFMSYAAQRIQEEQDNLAANNLPPMSAGKQVAITDAYRQMVGQTPLFYHVTKEGAVPRDFFYEQRAERTRSSGWANFKANAANSFLKLAGGPVGNITRLMDAVGVTDHATEWWADQYDAMDRVMAPQEGFSGIAGRVAGSLMYSIAIGGTGSLKAGTGAARLGVPLAFGVSAAGNAWTDVARRRMQGQDISLASEITYALGSGLIEAATELVGWEAARSLGTAVVHGFRPMRQILAREGAQAAANWASKQLFGQVLKSTAQGVTEEVVAQIGQNAIGKVTGVVPDKERGKWGLLAGTREAALAGGLAPGPLGLAQAGLTRLAGQQDIPGAPVYQPPQPELTPQQQVDALEARRLEIRKDDTIEDAEKEDIYEQLDQQIAEIQAPPQITPTEEGPITVEGQPIEAPAPPTPEAIAPEGVTEPTATQKVQEQLQVETPKEIAQSLAEDIKVEQEVTTEPIIPSAEKKGLVNAAKRIKQATQDYVLRQVRPERLFEQLDGGPKKGGLVDTVFTPTKQTAQNVRIAVDDGIKNLASTAKDVMGIDDKQLYRFMTKSTSVEGLKKGMTGSEKIGVYMANLNPESKRHLTVGNKLNQEQIDQIIGSMTPQETQFADWMLEQYEAQYPELAKIYKEVTGEELKKVDFYSPIITRKGSVDQSDSMTEKLVNSVIGKERAREVLGPEKGFTVEREKGAAQPIELDALSAMMYNISRLERFKRMAPLAKQLGDVLKSKDLRSAINGNTAGAGMKIIDKWFADTVRGHEIDSYSFTSRILNTLRVRGVTAALGFNVVTALKQPVSVMIGASHSPKMLAYTLRNMASSATPSGMKALDDFVNERSNIIRDRNIERELRTLMAEEKSANRLTKRTNLSQKSMALIQFMDRATVRLVWKARYDTAVSDGQSEAQAIKEADKWVGRTQPAANVEDLPDFFRGGPIEKLLTTFQNQINQNFNFWRHDIIGARKRGEISRSNVAYRVLMSYFMPALAIGLISRGGPDEEPEKEIKDAAVDLATYPLAPFYFIGPMISNLIQGYEPRTVADTLPSSLSRAAKSFTKEDPDVAKGLENMLKAVAAWKGIPLNQPLRTIKGALELQAGETKDPRRLIYSQAALGYKKKESTWP